DDPPLHRAGRDPRVADGRPERALEQGVARPDGGQVVVVEHVAVAGVAVGAQVEGHLLHRHPGRPHHLHGGRDDLRADAVAADHADAVGHLGSSPGWWGRCSRPEPGRQTKDRPPGWTVWGARRGDGARYTMM